MNKKLIFSVIIMAAITLSGCVATTAPVPQPISGSASGIIIRVPNICLPLTPCANKTVVFARLQDNNKLITDEIYQTSIEKGNHYYLLNVKPGRYVAVAATYSRGLNSAGSTGNANWTVSRSFGENILFSKELVNQTKVDVVPGVLAVMGEYDFKIEGRMAFAPSAAGFLKKADSVQTHYARMLDPEMQTRGATSAIKFYRGQPNKANTDFSTKKTLLESAKEHIGAEGWREHIVRSQK